MAILSRNVIQVFILIKRPALYNDLQGTVDEVATGVPNEVST